MREAVARFIPDGASVCMGAALEAAIPFAAGHELIRQRRRDLTLIGPISDMLFDQLVGAGCVRRIIAAWVGNVSAGLGHNYRRAVERGVPAPIDVEDHSNLTLAFALAGGRARRALPARAIAPRHRPRRVEPDVQDGRRSVVGRAAPARARARARRRRPPRPARRRGRARALLGHARRHAPGGARGAAGHRRGRGDPPARADPVGPRPRPRPRRSRWPPSCTSRSAPIPRRVQGCYRRHHEFFHRFHDESRTVEGNRAWLERFVHGVDDWPGFLAPGRRRRAGRAAHRAPAASRTRSTTEPDHEDHRDPGHHARHPDQAHDAAVGVVGGDAQADRRPRLDRRGRDGHRRGLRLRRAAGGGEHHRGEPGAPHRRPGPAAHRGDRRPHAPRHHDLRPARARHVRDQRRGDRAVGSARQAARRAGLPAPRRRHAAAPARLREPHALRLAEPTSPRRAGTSSPRASACSSSTRPTSPPCARRARRSGPTSS